MRFPHADFFAALAVLAAAIALTFNPIPAPAAPLASLPKLLRIGLRNTATEFCSCYFITGRTEESCQDYARINQFGVHFSIDKDAQTVRSRAIFDIWPMPSAKAQFVSASESCHIQDD